MSFNEMLISTCIESQMDDSPEQGHDFYPEGFRGCSC